MKNTAFLITSSGTTQEVKPIGTTFTMRELEMLVCGPVDVILIGNDKAMALNANGVTEGKPANYLATLAGGEDLDGPALGDVVILPAEMVGDH
jgi:hypothetical protein